MTRKYERPELRDREEVSRDLVRSIGEMDPYADADPEEVEERLRRMKYGATSRISRIRRGEADPVDTENDAD